MRTDRCLTERIAKRIRKGKPWNKSLYSDKQILGLAQHYAILRAFGAYCPAFGSR